MADYGISVKKGKKNSSGECKKTERLENEYNDVKDNFETNEENIKRNHARIEMKQKILKYYKVLLSF